MPHANSSNNFLPPFLQGGGEMGALIRSFNWQATALGSPESWPSALKQTVSMMLTIKYPVLICWGPDYIQLYNDAFRPINGETKHPQAMGGSARDTYAEIWQTIGPMFEAVTGGETLGFPDFMVPLNRNGQLEDCYFDFSYSPIYNEDGNTGGVLVICRETTEKVLSLQKLHDSYLAQQALNEEITVSNEELRAANDELLLTQEDLSDSLIKLVESEQRFRTMAEGTDILIAVSDETSNATYFNKAWSDFTGRPLNELLEFGWADLIHPADRQKFVDIYLACFKKQIAFTGEFRMLSKSGEYRWLLAKGPPRFNPDGSFAGYISSSVDITDRKNWEAKLQENSEELQTANEEMASTNEELASTNEELVTSNEELIEAQRQLELLGIERQNAIDRLQANEQNIRNMVAQAPVGMCIVEGDPLWMVEINESFLEIIGRTREEAQSKPYWEVIPEAREFYKPITDNVLATGETYYANEHEIVLVRNGLEEIVHIDFVYEPMKDVDGTAYAIMIVAIDVTEKVLDRKKVERAEQTLRMAIEAAGLGSYYINVIDRIFYPSARLKEFFGFAPDEDVPYEAAINQIHPDYRQAAADLVEAAITKGVRFDMEYPIIAHNDGGIRWVRGIGAVQKDGQGVNRYFTGVLHDITERKHDEIRKNDFIGMVSHELKTPLTSLTAIIQVLNARLKKSEDTFVSGALDKANTQVKKMGKMINGFLNVSRLESGKIMINKHPFKMEVLIEEMIAETELTTSSHLITCQPCDSVTISADQDKIGSVISNLISNAIKYSPKGTTINIKCEIVGNSVQISIKDEGIGVKQQDKEKLFERYYRVEDNNSRHVSGFGIGLYLSAEIIRRHNGKIWVESDGSNGSTFYFSLPLD